MISRNVVFNESAMLHDKLSTNVPVESEQNSSVQVEYSVGSGDTSDKENIVHDALIVEDPPIIEQPPQRFIAVDRPRREINPPKRLIEEANIVAYALSVAEEIEGNTDPSSYSEAINSTDCNKWITAMHDEMESLENNGTWELVKLQKEKKPIRCKWVFKRKKGISPNDETRYKAILVAKGYSQIPGIDFNEVFPLLLNIAQFTLCSV